MGGSRLKNISTYFSSMKVGSKKNKELTKYVNVNALLRDHHQGSIPDTTVLLILEILSELGPHAEADMRAIENGSDTEMSETVSAEENGMGAGVMGLSGKQICSPEEDPASASPNCGMILIDQLPHYKDAAWISAEIESSSEFLNNQLKSLMCYLQGGTNGCASYSEIKNQLFSCLSKVYADLQELQKLGKCHQALEYASLGPHSNLSGLHERHDPDVTIYSFPSFVSFFRCLKILTTDGQESTAISTLFMTALKSSWIFEGGPKQTIKLIKEKELYKSAPKRPFDIKVRFLGNQGELQLGLNGEPTLSLESKDGEAVTCKIKYTKYDFKDNSLIIKKVGFEKLRRLSGDGLTHNQNFYVLKLKLQVSYLDNVIDLEFKTFPFTVWESAHQIQESTGAVKWLVFSQEETKGDEYELKKDLPKQDVLQMFDLMLKYNSDRGGRHLVEKEWQELGRLLGRQNPGNSVTMASIFTDKMKAQDAANRRSGADCLDFSLFTWFQGGLNTLSHFHEYWMKGIIVGFYSRKDASELLKRNGRKKGDAVVRLSQTEVHHPQGETPFAHTTVHISLKTKRFIWSSKVTENSSFPASVLKYVDPETKNFVVPSIKQFLPTRTPLSEVCPQAQEYFAGSVERNRYVSSIRKSQATVQPIDEGVESMSLEDQTPPQDVELRKSCDDRNSPEDQTVFQPQISYREQTVPQQQTAYGYQTAPLQNFPYADQTAVLQQGPYGEPTASQHQSLHHGQSPPVYQSPYDVEQCSHKVSKPVPSGVQRLDSEEEIEGPPRKKLCQYCKISTSQQDPMMTSTVLCQCLQNLSPSELFFGNPENTFIFY